MPLLDDNTIEERLKELSHWEQVENEISRNFVCTDFRTAINFVNLVADLAEEMDHHPDILIHSWNNVSVTLSTHSEGGLTAKDFGLADKIQALFASLNVA
jgi:4a-hydroxytetrahydrobiopterin dehydratase